MGLVNPLCSLHIHNNSGTFFTGFRSKKFIAWRLKEDNRYDICQMLKGHEGRVFSIAYDE